MFGVGYFRFDVMIFIKVLFDRYFRVLTHMNPTKNSAGFPNQGLGYIFVQQTLEVRRQKLYTQKIFTKVAVIYNELTCKDIQASYYYIIRCTKLQQGSIFFDFICPSLRYTHCNDLFNGQSAAIQCIMKYIAQMDVHLKLLLRFPGLGIQNLK
ncbi:Hypothetical_protein [Hexamita inflata]|uniref:Hypothetical_protein n=1 Tax=Hexamita inflata TaxID=28002 RepID=A0AA86NJE9_9EUKA|nr:Hypothetical protein HINF_LOCUS8000 [Hexamita inflata]CAI9966687.1 Hypothetical protein HINF_LOCUS54332 [Hexamita inflata]